MKEMTIGDLLELEWKNNPLLLDGWKVAISKKDDGLFLLDDKKKIWYMANPLFKVDFTLTEWDKPKPCFFKLPFSFYQDITMGDIHCFMNVYSSS